MNLSTSEPEVNISALCTAAQRAADDYAIHHRLCRSRRDGRECRRCLDLESVADSAEDRFLFAVGAPIALVPPLHHEDGDPFAASTPCLPRIRLRCAACRVKVVACHVGTVSRSWRCPSCSGVS